MNRDITTLPPPPANERIPYGEDRDQFFAVWNAREPARGAVVMIHGGFWRSRYDLWHTGHLCAALAGTGLTAISIEYRRVGWPGTFEDVKAGVAAAAAHLGARPVVIGHSAGGHLVLLLAAQPGNIRGVVALAAVADLQLAYELHLSHDAVIEFLGGPPQQLPRVYADADPRMHAPLVRTTLIHGTNDDNVPIQLSRNYADSHPGGNVNLIEIAGANHFDLIDPASSSWPAVLNAVSARLTP